MTRFAISSRTSSRLALIPWLACCFTLTGCPLSDHYSLTDASGGDSNDAGGGSSPGGSQPAGAAGLGGSSGANAADAGAGSANGTAKNGGSSSRGGSSGSGSGGTVGTGGTGGEPSAGTVGSGGVGNSAGVGAGAPNLGGDAGRSSTGGSPGSGGGAAASGSAGVSGSGVSGVGGGSSCSALSCNYTCCAASGACADTTRDFQNCGSCGSLCNAGRSCMSSACTSGWVGMAPPPMGFGARWRAASVALGSSVFIWGGSDAAGGVLDSGAIYSPVTDTWTTVAKDAYTPTARVLATAVWTGSVVVIFGGSDAAGGAPYKDGALYDPAKNAWSAMPAAGKARAASLGFWDGTRAVFWGGLGAAGTAVAGADRFDLSTWSASSVTNDPGAVLNPAAGWDGTTLYLEGGQIAGARTDKVSSYTSNTDTWAALSKSLSGRSNAFGAWDGTRFVVWGGCDNMGLRNDGKYYQGSATWTALSAPGAPTARMAVPRRSGWIFQTKPGLLALFGGETSTFGQGTFSTTGATYDVSNGKWGAVPAFPSGETHDYGVAVWTGEEFVLWGGRTGAALSPTLTGERWKP